MIFQLWTLASFNRISRQLHTVVSLPFPMGHSRTNWKQNFSRKTYWKCLLEPPQADAPGTLSFPVAQFVETTNPNTVERSANATLLMEDDILEQIFQDPHGNEHNRITEVQPMIRKQPHRRARIHLRMLSPWWTSVSHTESWLSENDDEARRLGNETRAVRQNLIVERFVADRAALARLADNQTQQITLSEEDFDAIKKSSWKPEDSFRNQQQCELFPPLRNKGAQANSFTFYVRHRLNSIIYIYIYSKAIYFNTETTLLTVFSLNSEWEKVLLIKSFKSLPRSRS